MHPRALGTSVQESRSDTVVASCTCNCRICFDDKVFAQQPDWSRESSAVSSFKTEYNMKRRDFLRIGTTAAAAGSSWASLIEKALGLQPNNPTGTPGLADIEHVIIFMQENRSFDHYLGTLRGVRGYGDPRPAPIPSGNYVWYQPEGTNPASRGFSTDVSTSEWTTPSLWYESDREVQSSDYVLPFRLNQSGNVAFQYITDLNHSWKASQDIWKNWDTWVPLKSRQSMGSLDATDLPFYHLLADAFTVCDDYHCSVFAATDPNRIYLWSGTCPPPMNFPDNYTTGGYVADIAHDNNSKITPAMYGQSEVARSAAVAAGVADWKTYPETLTDAGITWKVYQEYDNYGDNYLQYFKNFRIDNTGAPINESSDPYFQTLYLRGRTFAPQSGDIGDAVIAEFARDVAAGMEPDGLKLGVVEPGLPRVSWIVAPYARCEHPSASPGDGESFTAKLLDVLVNQYPQVFRKTAFLLMYDENDGYYDHVPAPIPAISAEYGDMTLGTAGADEDYSSVPVGLGPRVPMIVISPWSRGGRVSSQVCDHTSVLRFLETWLTAKRLASAEAVRCELISAWRRAVCSDLTEAFDFRRPSPTNALDTETNFVNGVEKPAVPSPQVFPALPAPQPKAACSVGYDFAVHGNAEAGRYSLSLANTGSAGAVLIAYWMPMSDGQTPFQYTLEAGKSLVAAPVQLATDGAYDWSVYGPNGFLREFRGRVTTDRQGPEASVVHGVRGEIRITLDNRHGSAPCLFYLADNAYSQNTRREVRVAPGRVESVNWAGCRGERFRPGGTDGWYDLSVRVSGDPNYLRRMAGCARADDVTAITDPAIGNTTLFKPTVYVHDVAPRAAVAQLDYVTPPWHHRPKNWIGVFKAGAPPVSGGYVAWVYAPRGVGSVTLPISGLSPGKYEVWYLFDDGFTALAGPASMQVGLH